MDGDLLHTPELGPGRPMRSAVIMSETRDAAADAKLHAGSVGRFALARCVARALGAAVRVDSACANAMPAKGSFLG